MKTRRSFLALVGLASAALACPARAFEFHPYDPAQVEKAIASGKPVIVHVYASWCLQCHMQASILDNLKNDPLMITPPIFGSTTTTRRTWWRSSTARARR